VKILLADAGLGLIAPAAFRPSGWFSNTKQSCSLFLIGMAMLAKIHVHPQQAFAAVVELSLTVGGNWG